MYINHLTNLFFIFFIINFFITFYSIYTFFEIYIFHNKQGLKLNIKKNNFFIKGEKIEK